MKRVPSAGLRLAGPNIRRRRARSIARLGLLTATAIGAAYLAWPYVTLWRLDTAARSADPRDLAVLVDMNAVRGELKRKLNKDADSSIERLSDPFIHWLEDGIRAKGSQAVDELVTLHWVRERLLEHAEPDAGEGFMGQVAGAYLDGPTSFRLSIGSDGDLPVHVRMRLDGLSWRVSAVYY
jgi:hypothetical protein